MVEPYQAQFIQFLLDREVLRIGGPYELKSKRLSPYFLDLGKVNDGEGLGRLGDAYADAILTNVKPEDFDGIVGIPQRVHSGFGPSIPISLARKGHNKTYSSWRDRPKSYGAATISSAQQMKYYGGTMPQSLQQGLDDDKKRMLIDSPKEQRQAEYVLGAPILKGSRQVVVDDVMTAGDAKEEALSVIEWLSECVVVPALVIAASRQEIDEYGENAIQSFTDRHGIPVYYPITAADIFDYLKETGKITPQDEAAFLAYLRAWGTVGVREKYGLTSSHLIEGRSVIPACDTDSLELFEEVVRETAGNPKIGGYKTGFMLALKYGLPKVVEVVRKHAPEKKVIHDNQKAGTDIADVQIARAYAKSLVNAGVDAAILFPQSGPVTQTAWTGEALQAGLHVIIGGDMTHKGYLSKEGGYIRDDAPDEIYRRAARHGMADFVVPGNRPEMVAHYADILSEEDVDPSFFAPGFVEQGGVISEAGKAAGNNFNAIVGRAIMNAKDKGKAAEEMTSQL